ncbi:MAG: periplasmic heavy metal sensor [Acidobacteria bacterium]|nr:periplasmic heavy metal sensor [Acidobacteriota bacterium]MCI0664780.1 periplasmic heavy metal sensor [Acidobacteriota bacterium]
MEIGDKSKWQVRIVVLVIFALGFVAGALSWNIYRSYRPGPLFDGRRDRYEQMMNQLQLTQEQRTQVEKILSDAAAQWMELRKQSYPRMREIRSQTDQRLQAVLTLEQWEQFKQMRDEMRGGRRGRGRGRRE